MPPLRPAFEAFLTDWQKDLSAPWREILKGVEPDLDAVGHDLTLDPGETIFPGRKGKPAPGARPDAHVFRALDGVHPRDVKAVILGQDPYPKASRATGRSFEQGDLPKWVKDRKVVAESLRRILQVVANFRTGEAKYLAGDGAWADLVADIDANAIDIAAPLPFFDDWQSKGVLCLNAGLTLSRFQPAVQQAHFALWRPVVKQILTALALRKSRSVVFLLWGNVARTTFEGFGIPMNERVGVVTDVHPGAEDNAGKPRFFEPPNTFAVANEKLEAMGAGPIEW